MHVVEAVQVVVLDVPGEPTEGHADVQHRRVDPGDLVPHEAQERAGAPGGAAHVPGRLPDVRLLTRGPCSAGGGGGEARARHVAGVVDRDGAVGGYGGGGGGYGGSRGGSGGGNWRE